MAIGNLVTLPQILSQENKINTEDLPAVLIVTLSNKNIYLGNIVKQLLEKKEIFEKSSSTVTSRNHIF